MMKKKTSNRLAAAAGLAPMEIPQATDPSSFDTSAWEILSPQPSSAALSELPEWSSVSPMVPSSPYSGPPTGDGDSNIRRKLRKTRVCKHFLKGRCHYGTNCTFAHYDSELFKKPNLARTKLCAKPNCSDPDCTYAHSVEELRQPGEASDMDTARVDIEHEKVLGEQRALLTVHNMMAQTGNDGVESASPGILPSPSLLPTPPARFSPTVAGTTTGGGATSGGIARPDRSHSRGSVHRSTLNALAAKNEELRRQVEMSNTVLAHLLQIASAQTVPETPYVAVTPPTNVFSQQQRQPQQPVTTPATSDTEEGKAVAVEGATEAADDSSGLHNLDEEVFTNLLATISGDTATRQWNSDAAGAAANAEAIGGSLKVLAEAPGVEPDGSPFVEKM